MARTILIVDDDALLRRSLSIQLEEAGYRAQTAASAEEALPLVATDPPDLILLDVGLPGIDGLEALRRFQQQQDIPVIFVTARRREIDTILGLELGADSYVTKPFNPDVLLAHIRAVLRRSEPQAAADPAVITVGDLQIDPAAHSVNVGGRSVELTAREFALLLALARLPPEIDQVALRDAAGRLLDGRSSDWSPPTETAGVTIRYNVWQASASVALPVLNADRELLGIIEISQRLDTVAAGLTWMRLFIFAVLGATLALGAGLGALLALRLSRPLEQVVAQLDALAAGQRQGPLPETGPRELRRLSAAANQLAARLAELERIRQRSLANIVHEIGRPLGVVRAAVHVVRGKAGADAALREELLGGAEGEIERVQPLLEDLVQVQRTNHTLAIQSTRLEVKPWLDMVARPWQAAALEKGLAWHSDLPDDLPAICADGEQLARALGNLLSNAVKYTPSGGQIRLAATKTADQLRITVTDSGPGIAADEQQHIFEPFYRSERQARFPQGLGLGLSIAQRIVAAHGGRIEVTSTLGSGSTFGIVLPLTAAWCMTEDRNGRQSEL